MWMVCIILLQSSFCFYMPKSIRNILHSRKCEFRVNGRSGVMYVCVCVWKWKPKTLTNGCNYRFGWCSIQLWAKTKAYTNNSITVACLHCICVQCTQHTTLSNMLRAVMGLWWRLDTINMLQYMERMRERRTKTVEKRRRMAEKIDSFCSAQCAHWLKTPLHKTMNTKTKQEAHL